MSNNVEMKIEKNILTVIIDLSKDLGPSKSGKTKLCATTGGNIRLQTGHSLGINCYK